ncbi:histidine triad nucleotide-binding protein [Methyloterricola oryzae]|uniref:histidine triad nucleotide-binding protein n=1 Tax=Methyloterricola oryzae TaxID=1495050 RepID=UPI0005EBB6AA|nr:histidine triad nucleotide-binding protein [Methyloterricola oryzae]
MSDCLFCKMVAGDIKPNIVLETDHVLAFRDIRPQAPTHVLVIPKQHIATLDDFPAENVPLAGALLAAVQQVAKLEGLDRDGYRTVINCRANGGQEVYHLHLHVLGGRALHWPPG